ncbi:hypothetical protein CPB85DRAFT_1289600 [Mucidula mucida]|nr:hypothetical protein CPB85DRAFT_1289600 [Mucidula mucida]
MCFRNAALQGLVHTSEFAQLFLQLGEVLKRDEFIHVAPLVHATVDFIRMFYHKAGTNRDPQHNFWVNKDVTVGHPLEPSTKLFAALTAAMPDLFKATPITVEQGENLVMQSEEDSGEFLMSYFNKLNFEFDLIGRVLRSPAWRPSSSQLAKDYMRNPKQTSIYRLFGAAISERVHFVMTIPIDKSVVDVAGCLRLYFQHLPEPAYFEQLPSVLVLNLGRFVFGSRGGVQTTFKELKMIKIPQVLTIPEALISSYFQLPSIVNYRLFAVVYHHGPTAVTGHYTADAAHPGYRLHHHRARDEKDTRPWFRANDTSVSHLQATEVYRTPDCPDGKPSTKTPFVLFYEQIPA